MMYLFLFDHGSNEEGTVRSLSKSEASTEQESECQCELIFVRVHRGTQVSGQMSFLLKDDGIFLHDDSVQYCIPFENIEHVFIEAPEKAYERISIFRRLFSRESGEGVYYVVLGYRNAANKLKVLTLQFPGYSWETVEKLKNRF